MIAEFTVDKTLLLVAHPRVLGQLDCERIHVALVEHLKALLKRLLMVSENLNDVQLAFMAEH